MLRWMPASARRPLLRQRGRDDGAPIAALSHVARVAKAAHELAPGSGDAGGVPAALGRLVREGKARQGRRDDVEGVLGTAAMGRRVRQRLDDLEELDHRARPAVRDEDRQRVCLSRADVQEVNGEAVDLRAKLRKAIQPGLAAAPVIPGPPILHQRLQLRDRHALRPVGDRLRVRPARLRQTPLQVVEGASRRAVAGRA